MNRVAVPPWDCLAEQAVLGGLMLAPQHIQTITEQLRVSDFYRRDHQVLFRALVALAARGESADAVTLADYLQAQGLDDLAGGPGYAVQLAATTPSAANLGAYIRIVAEHACRRELIELFERGIRASSDRSEDITTLIGQTHAALLALDRQGGHGEQILAAVAARVLDRARQHRGELPGLPTGLRDLDDVLGGLHSSDLIVIAARPAMGKTALMCNLVDVCENPVGILSAEQPAEQISARLLALRANVPFERWRRGGLNDGDLVRLAEAAESLAPVGTMIHDQAAPAIADVERIARKWKDEQDIAALFVDYVQRIDASRADKRAPKHERVGEVVRGLKNLARDLDIPVIALAQVSREAEGRPGGRPQLADLSDSSEIEKEADAVLTLYRPHVYRSSEPPGLAVLDICKNRHGRTGSVHLAWRPEWMRFGNYAGHL